MECRVATIRLPQTAPARPPISPSEKTRATLACRIVQLPSLPPSGAVSAGTPGPAFVAAQSRILGCDLGPCPVLTSPKVSVGSVPLTGKCEAWKPHVAALPPSSSPASRPWGPEFAFHCSVLGHARWLVARNSKFEEFFKITNALF